MRGPAERPSTSEDVSAGSGVAAADAERNAEAKRAFEEGLTSLRDERWSDAETAFRRSLGLVSRTSTLYDLAFVVYMQGRPRECLSLLEKLGSSDVPADPKYQSYAAALTERALARLSSLRFLVSPPTAKVRVDGEAIPESAAGRPLRVLPGRHDVEVFAPGYVTKRLELVTRPGTELEREVELEPLLPQRANPPPAAETRTSTGAHSFLNAAPWLVVGTGSALLIAGVVTGILAKNADDEFQRGCPSNSKCDPSLESTRERAVGLAHAADVLYASGGVLVAGGITWRLLAPTVRKSAQSRSVFVGISASY